MGLCGCGVGWIGGARDSFSSTGRNCRIRHRRKGVYCRDAKVVSDSQQSSFRGLIYFAMARCDVYRLFKICFVL